MEREGDKTGVGGNRREESLICSHLKFLGISQSSNWAGEVDGLKNVVLRKRPGNVFC